MKRILLLFLLCPLICHAGIARVQFATGQVNSASTLTVTLGAAPTKGNILIVGVTSTTRLNSAYDTATASLTRANYTFSQSIQTSTNQFLYMGYAPVTDSSFSATQTFALPSAAAIAGIVVEYSGQNIRVDRLVGGSGGPSNNSGSPAPGTATGDTNFANELFISLLASRGQFASTGQTVYSSPTNSFAIVGQANTNVNTANSDRDICLLEKFATSVVTSGGSGVNGGATITSQQWVATGMTFNESTGSFSRIFGYNPFPKDKYANAWQWLKNGGLLGNKL